MSALARRLGVDREGVNAAIQLGGKGFVDHAVARQAGLPAEGIRHDIDAEMRLSARPVACMAFVLVRFILHFQALRAESGGQLFGDTLSGLHFARILMSHRPVKLAENAKAPMSKA